MNINWQEIILALIMAIPGAWSLFKQYKKDQSSVRSTDADTISKYIAMVDKLTLEVSELRNEVVSLRGENSSLKTINCELLAGITLLISQLVVLHQTPVWRPSPDLEKKVVQ